ncbi:MAG: Ig-like domain-containing protein [Actinomycetota bacterium]
MFFDPAYTRVFNRFHHLPQGSSDPTIDCHWLRTENGHTGGDSCWGGVYSLRSLGDATWTNSNRSTGWIDGTGRLWLEMTRRGFGYGFACLDVNGAMPQPCAAGSWYLLESASPFESYDEVMDIAAVGGKVFTQTVSGNVLCLDTLAPGGPAACPGQPYNFGARAGSFAMADASSQKGDLTAIRGKVYYLRSSSNDSGAATCIDPGLITIGATASSIRCAGWPASLQSVGCGPLFAAPNAQGLPVAVCGFSNSICLNLQDGTTTVTGLPAGLSAYLNTTKYGALGSGRMYTGPATAGARLYWPNRPLGVSDVNQRLECFDAATNAACSGWPKVVREVYAVRVDPANPKCIWTNGNDGVIRVFDAFTGAVGCTQIAPLVSFPANVAIPRMACSSNSGIQEWVDFRIAGNGSPDKLWTSATITIRTPTGAVVPGWEDVPIPANGILPLTGLPVSGGSGAGAWVAGDLDFRVTFADPTYVTAPQATIKAIGDAPQLCITATAPVVCPAVSPGPIPQPANASTMAALGDGTATDASNNVTNLIQGSVTVSISAPSIAQCSGTINGRATDTSPTPRPVAGSVVALYDSSGTAVVYPAGHPQAGQPVTTTTDSNGDYAFTGLAPTGYKARFVDTATVSAVSSTVAAGGSGTVTASSGAVTSNASTIAAGGTGTINARFTIASSTTPNTSTGAQGASQTINPLTNDTPLSGGSFTASTVKLCTTSTANGSCTGTSLDMPAEGRYTVSNGVVTFQPCSAAASPIASCTGPFTGPATAVKYVVTDSGSNVVSSTITPTVVAVPSATNNTSTGDWDTNQTISVLGNDSAANGATHTANTVKLCPNPQPASPYTAANCNLSSLTVNGEGTYTANADGTVTFDPVPSFRGQAPTPVRYVVQDSVSQIASALITPTVSPPAAPVAAPEGKVVIPGGTATFSNLITGQGALATGQGLQTGNTNGPCLIDPADSVCKATFTITGEGTWTVNRTTGVATFQASVGATPGQKTPVTYRVTDITGQTASAQLTPTIPPPPVATSDTSTGVVDANQIIAVLANDQAGAGAGLSAGTVKLCTQATSPASCTQGTLTVNGEGTYTANNDGTVTFDPVPSFTGTATPIRYVVDDNAGQRASALITPRVVSIPAPAAAPDTTVGLAGRDQLINPLTNDQAGSATYPLDASSVRLCGGGDVAPACTQTSLTTADGTYSVNPLTGFITYSPVSGMLGTASAVTYAVTDGAGQRTTSTYMPSVVGAGPPQVSPATVSVAHGTPGILSPQVIAGSAPIDPAKACLAAPGSTCAPGETSLTRPEGTYVLDAATGVITFTPAPGFSGTPADPPLFCATDQAGQQACATLTPTVAPPPAPPVTPSGNDLPGSPTPSALPNVQSTMAGQPVTIAVLANDSASSGAMLDPSSVRLRDPRTGRYQQSVSIPGQGTLRVNPDGTVTFTPLPGFIGTTPAVGYRVADTLGRTTASTVTVIVRDTPPPWADPQYGQAMRGGQVAFDPIGANSAGRDAFVPSSVRIRDPETGKWTTRVVVPGEGTWTVDPKTGQVRFTPRADFTGAATPMRYRLANARGQKVSSTLNPVIRDRDPALAITTRASRATLRPGQTSLITLRIANHGLATTTRTVTRAPIPKGFSVANPMGGNVRGGWIWFTTGNLKAGGATTRRFVLVATTAGVGRGNQQVMGTATSSNTRSATDPTSLRVIGAVTGRAAVTG